MKSVITGIVFSFAAVGLCAATGGMSAAMRAGGGSMAASEGRLGPLRLYFGLRGAYSLKNVKVTTHMTTTFKAGYLYAPKGAQTFETRWMLDAEDAAGVENRVRPLAAQALAGFANFPANVSVKFAFDGAQPSHWLIDTRNDGNDAPWDAGDVGSATRAHILAACFDNERAGGNLGQKAWVESGDRAAHAQNMTTFDYSEWGLRLEGGLGFNILGNLTLFVLCSYKFDFKSKDAKTSQDDAVFTQLAEEYTTFDAADGSTKIKADLLSASFAYNKNVLASGVKIATKVTETFGVMGGLDWRPWSALSLYVKAGVKRYALEVSYEGGDLAYPGTVGMFSDAFTKENGRYKLLRAQGKDVRKMTAIAWPIAFGGGVRAVCGMHSFDIGVDYATGVEKLSVANSTKPKAPKKGETHGYTTENMLHKRSLESPYNGNPTQAQMRDAMGTHQFAATDVVNRIETSVELSDLTLSAGYMLSL